MAEVSLREAAKVYGDGTRALDGLNLEIRDGELMVFVGPSGCGKTTALRMIAGLEEITSGTITIGDSVINNVTAKDRDIAMVFQNYALYPHMTVYKNLSFPLRIKGVPRAERDARVQRVGALLGLTEHFDRRPRQLSGGQRQRVAMGRAIVREPRVFLMDEPLSNLDAKLRVQMRAEIGALQRELNATMIYVTHDQVEAMTMGHRVAVLRRGFLQQVDTPEALYNWPANVFVAGFIGSPPMNLFEGTIVDVAGGLAVQVGQSTIRLDDDEERAVRSWAKSGRQRIVVGVRPESFEESPHDGSRERRVAGIVALRESLGSDILVHFVAGGAAKLSSDLWRLAHDVEDPAELEGASGPAHTVIARVRPESRLRPGEHVELAVKSSSLRFFDPDSGMAVASERLEAGLT